MFHVYTPKTRGARQMTEQNTLGIDLIEILYIQALIESINSYVRPYEYKEIGA